MQVETSDRLAEIRRAAMLGPTRLVVDGAFEQWYLVFAGPPLPINLPK